MSSNNTSCFAMSSFKVLNIMNQRERCNAIFSSLEQFAVGHTEP
jgi:hypothetical protein